MGKGKRLPFLIQEFFIRDRLKSLIAVFTLFIISLSTKTKDQFHQSNNENIATKPDKKADLENLSA